MQKIIHIDDDGRHLKIWPAPDCVRMLSTRVRRLHHSALGGFELRRDVVPFTQEDENPTAVWCRSTLGPAVERILSRENHQIRFRNLAPLNSLGEIETAYVSPDNLEVDFRTLDFIDSGRRGLFYVSTDLVLESLLQKILDAWPDRRFVIACGSLKEVVRLKRTLLSVGLIAVRTGKTGQAGLGRVTLCTTTIAGLGTFEFRRGDTVIVYSALKLCGSEGIDILNHIRPERIFGILYTGQFLPPRDQAYLRNVYGFRDCFVDTAGWQAQVPKFTFLPVKHEVRLTGSLSEVELKRAAIWKNSARNSAIVNLVTQLRNRNWEALPAPLRQHLTDVKFPRDRKPNLAVFVENYEHALELSRRRDNLPIIRRLDHFDRFSDSSVCTVYFADKLAEQRFDVLVRADGNCGELPLVGNRIFEMYYKRVRPALVVDFLDRSHSQFKFFSKRRMARYRERGWSEVGQTPMDAAVANFLTQIRTEFNDGI